jgi:isopentenyl phosphate kinase
MERGAGVELGDGESGIAVRPGAAAVRGEEEASIVSRPDLSIGRELHGVLIDVHGGGANVHPRASAVRRSPEADATDPDAAVGGHLDDQV